MVKLEDICTKSSSNIAQKDLEGHDGIYPIYGASGLIKYVDFYQQEKPYVAIVKDGAGVGRVMRLPAKSSVIGTMQYIIPRKDVDVDYLAYAIEHMNLARYCTGATIPHIYFKDYCVETLPEYTSDEQKHIALLFHKVDGLLSLRAQQLAKLDELVKAQFVEMFGDPTTNPKRLKIVHLSEIAEYFNGLTYRPENVSDMGTIVLRSSNIQENQLDFADTVRVDCQIKERLFVKENDILMCSRNGSARLVGKVALIKGLNEPMSFGAFMMIIRSRYYPYLITYFQTDNFRRQIKTGATTTINQITGRMLDEVELPVPKLRDMTMFTTFTEKIFRHKFTIQQSLNKLELLKKSLMQKYFG